MCARSVAMKVFKIGNTSFYAAFQVYSIFVYTHR